jgi:pimeloyl-ACP methyl ester carboxylesterase
MYLHINYPYIGTSNESYSDAIQAVIDTTESKVWLIAHSAGASRAVTAARQKKQQVNGLILIEPAGPPDADDFPDLDGLHMFGVYGDYIASRNQTNRKLATEAAAVLFQNAGGVADVVSLPEDSLVFGNSHILMQDLNSEFVFNIIEHWLSSLAPTLLVLKVNLIIISSLTFIQTQLAMKFGLRVTQWMLLNTAFIQWMDDYCKSPQS